MHCVAIDHGASTLANVTEWEATVEQAIRATGRTALRGVTIQARRDTVVLLGRVPSYDDKQLAQATARQGAGDHRIINDVTVVPGCGERPTR